MAEGILMEWWQAVILGLVEGITEYLPVSSTGHLILTSALLGLDGPELKASVDAFSIVIQGGAILAVLGLYRERVVEMLLGLVGQNPRGLRLALLILTAFVPAVVLGLALDEWIESRLFRSLPVLGALALGGVWMIWLDRARLRAHRRDASGDRAGEGAGEEADEGAGEEPVADGADELHALSFRQAALIGLLQCVAMWPGTSRSMMTIAGGVLVGLKPARAAEFSFLLGLPTLGGACVYKLYKNVSESAAANEPNMFDVIGWGPIVVGTAVATVSAAVAVKWLVGFLNRRGLEPFGWYRIVLAAGLGGAILLGTVAIEPPTAEADAGGGAGERVPAEEGSGTE
ncbi:MAG: undecaprenyl-diphosphate phosphatase [Planctomycetota bacterium]